MTLALSPIGPESVGLQYRLTTTNDGEMVVEVLDITGGGGGNAARLTNVTYVDKSTEVPLADRNGAIVLPFKTFIDGRDNTPPSGVLFLTPDDYSLEGVIAIPQSINIVSLSEGKPASAICAGMTIAAGKVCYQQGLSVTGPGVSGGTGILVARQSQYASVNVSSANLYDQTIVVGTVTCSDLIADNTQFSDAVSVANTIAHLTKCTFSGAHTITFTGAAGRLLLDTSTYRNFLSAGWSVVNGTIQSNDFLPPVSTAATLATPAYANAPLGIGVYHSARKRMFYAVPVGQGDIAGTSNDWKGDSSTSSPSWLGVLGTPLPYFIDSVAGNDDNTGADSVHALKSTAELIARLGGKGNIAAFNLLTNITVSYMADEAGGVFRPHITNTGTAGAPPYVNFRVRGITTPLTVLVGGAPAATAVVATATAPDPVTGHPGKITCTGVVDWTIAGPGGTSLVSNLLTQNVRGRIVGGARDGVIFFISKANPDAGDTNAVARVSLGRRQSNVFQAPVVPQVGDTVVFESLPTLQTMDIIGTGVGTPTGSADALTYQLGMFDLRLTTPALQFEGYAPDMIMFGCIVQKGFAPGYESQGKQQPDVWSSWVDQLWIDGGDVSNCLLTSLQNTGSITGQINVTGTVYTGGNLLQSTGWRVNGAGSLVAFEAGSDYIVDATNFGVEMLPGANVFATTSGFNGYNNGDVGVLARSACLWGYTSGVTSQVTGVNGDIRVRGGVSNINKIIPWTAVPWNDGAKSYLDTLAAGTKNVTITYADSTQVVNAQCRTPAGVGAPGVYSCPDASRTNTNVTVNSSVATETSTINVTVSALGTGAQFLRQQ